jgi:hypothetical protein
MAEGVSKVAAGSKNDFTYGAPPPNQQQRSLIFDSLMKIVGKEGGKRQEVEKEVVRGWDECGWGPR